MWVLYLILAISFLGFFCYNIHTWMNDDSYASWVDYIAEHIEKKTNIDLTYSNLGKFLMYTVKFWVFTLSLILMIFCFVKMGLSLGID